jgi:selenocysteine-specific elongation factor
MKNINLVIVGQSQSGKSSIAKALAQKSEQTESDMPIHQYRYGDANVTIMDTLGDPMDVKTAIQGASIADGVVLAVPCDSGPNMQTGEKIIISDMFGLNKGVIALTKTDIATDQDIEETKKKIKNFIAGTNLENLEMVEVSATANTGIPDLRQKLSDMEEPERDSSSSFRFNVIHSFERGGRGIGNGIIQSGSINAHSKIQLMPWGKVFPVDHILFNDKNVNDAKAGEMIGVAIKGVFPWDMPRGTIFCDEGSLLSSKEIDCELEIHKFYKSELNVGQELSCSIGLQWFNVEIKKIEGEPKPGSKIKLKLETKELKYPIVFSKGEQFLITRPDLSFTQLRVCGKAKVI